MPTAHRLLSRATLAGAALAALAAGACTGGAPARGSARPTVEGGGDGGYADLAAAKAAFARSSGPLSAVLLDAAWIRLEPDPSEAESRHPDYFAGLTSFQVSVMTQDFVRPTDETYLLEDSTGASVTAKPESYRHDVTRGLGPKHATTFDLTFRHAMSKDVRWLRLTRRGPGGGTVEWSFP
jgi:hypothetical protein